MSREISFPINSSSPSLTSSTPYSSSASHLFSFTLSFIQRSWDYVGHFFPRPRILGFRPNTAPGSEIPPNELTNPSYATLGIPIVVTMAGCLLLLRAFRPRRNGREQSHALLNNEPATSSLDDGSHEDSNSTKGNAIDAHGRSAGSRSEHLERKGVHDTDPGLLKKHSSNISYTTPIATYPSIRTFVYPHPHIDKLPTEPSPLPLLVFIHGLGGSLVQFHPLLTSLITIAPCFGIDFPGCGLSSFSPKSWTPYSIEALATLVTVAVEQHRDKERDQKVILVAHSLGSAISTLIASSKSPVISSLREHVIGIVAICPPAGPPPKEETLMFRRMLYTPDLILNLFRIWDRRGGINSPSVLRFVGEGADMETRNIQLRFNQHSKTPVWRRMVWGILPTYDSNGEAIGGLPGKQVWAGVDVPLLLIAGEADKVTKPEEAIKILAYFNMERGQSTESRFPEGQLEGRDFGDQGGNTIPDAQPSQAKGMNSDVSSSVNPSGILESESGTRGGKRGVKAYIFPAPASHALLYDRSTCRTLSGLIQDFLEKQVDPRLGLGWQLQHLTTSGKWDVKNLEKWKATNPVSDVMGNTFVAMKTLREVDEKHTPVSFAQQWKGRIYAVIDISHESPVYDPAQLEKGGIQYHKLPTISKIPPTIDEVRDFVSLASRLEEEITSVSGNLSDGAPRPVIAVHCHYGFNRTGFFVASYLIERKGFPVQEAIDEFGKVRFPGIKHEHFIDTLFARYCVGLKGASASSLGG
ncbi:hypothetical protein GX48_00203 [Paracoccidioides brasiliensis]|nr:hypothetical protein GX48_00203 [Paracoccidioides brasiliensis]